MDLTNLDENQKIDVANVVYELLASTNNVPFKLFKYYGVFFDIFSVEVKDYNCHLFKLVRDLFFDFDNEGTIQNSDFRGCTGGINECIALIDNVIGERITRRVRFATACIDYATEKGDQDFLNEIQKRIK